MLRCLLERDVDDTSCIPELTRSVTDEEVGEVHDCDFRWVCDTWCLLQTPPPPPLESDASTAGRVRAHARLGRVRRRAARASRLLVVGFHHEYSVRR